MASLVVVGRSGMRIECGLVGREGMTGFALVDGDEQTPFELVNQIEGAALALAVEDFRQVLVTLPELRLLASRFARSLSVQVSYTAFANGRFEIPQRLARWLVMMQDRLPGQRHFRLTHDYLSIMLGVRRPSVTSALHTLEGERFIKSTRSHVEISDRDGLIRFAGEAYGIAEEEYARLMSLPLKDWPQASPGELGVVFHG